MTRTLKPAAILLAIVTAAMVGGCASGGPKKPPTGTPEPDKFLWERGTENLNDKKWVVAREYFRQLVDSYPQSRYRADAKLGMGDTYLGERSAESFVLAANEFREFLSFYPTHERADYAQYKLGMTYFYQMRAAMRDQTETRNAIKELQAFIPKYPNSPLLPEVKEHLREAKDRIDDWDTGVAKHYFQIKWYPGVIGRLKPLMETDPEYTRRDDVYYLYGESLARIGRQAEALVLFERLVKEFEQSEHLEYAKKRIEELKAATPAGPAKEIPKGQNP